MNPKLFDQNHITVDFLDSMRQHADPLADDLIKQILEHSDLNTLNQVFLKIVNNTTIHDESFTDFDEAIRKLLTTYFKESAQLPTWYDEDLVAEGEKLFSEYGPEMFMLLNVSSLPMCYTCAKGAQVLYDTGRLMSHHQNTDALARRLMETGQMIFNVLSPGGLSQQGAGIITIQKVRLIHASIRYYLLKEDPKRNYQWDIEELGLPINQEDMAGTLMSFGPVILNGLKNLNIELTEQQQLAYMHVWKVVGHLMGLKAELNPDSFQEGFQLASKVLQHQASNSEAGEALTNSCVLFLQQHIAGNLFDEVPTFMMAYFLTDFSEASGKDLATIIGLKKKEDLIERISLKFSQFLGAELHRLEHHKVIQMLSAHFNKALLAGIIKHYNDNKSVHFYIPSSLTKNWSLAPIISYE